jgi:hypothetical protein
MTVINFGEAFFHKRVRKQAIQYWYAAVSDWHAGKLDQESLVEILIKLARIIFPDDAGYEEACVGINTWFAVADVALIRRKYDLAGMSDGLVIANAVHGAFP